MTEETLRAIEGQIININTAKRGIAVRNLEGITEGFTWSPAQDKEFLRLKAGWYAKITLEKQGEQWIAISQAKGQRPAGQRRHEPAENQRGILTSVLIKAYTELFIHSMVPDEIDFISARADIRKAVEEDLPEWLRIGGA